MQSVRHGVLVTLKFAHASVPVQLLNMGAKMALYSLAVALSAQQQTRLINLSSSLPTVSSIQHHEFCAALEGRAGVTSQL